jgi:hypothetical protein
MHSVVLKGADTGTAIRKPGQSITVSGSGRIWIDPIDMFGERCTYRKVMLTNGTPLGQKAICFGIRLKNFELEVPGIPNLIRYPQKHVIEFKIYGANGSNGFILDATGYGSANMSTQKTLYREGFAPFLFAQSLAIGINDDSSIDNNWFIDEPEYFSQDTGESGSAPDLSLAGEIYTRPFVPYLVFERFGYGDSFRIMKGLSLLYSRRNVVTFRVTVEVLSREERHVSVRKFIGGESLS